MAADGVGGARDWATLGPTTYEGWCLDRIATALEVLALGQQPAQEEKPAAEPGTPLPEDFPGRERLAEAGIVYLEALPRKGEKLAALGLNGLEINRALSYVKAVG